jgi:DNA-binding response OmpR family regulator
MPKQRILIVEDEADVAQLIKHTLQRGLDAETTVAASGDLALKLVPEWQPDLVVLDLNLPGVDGTDVCRVLRSRPATRDIPIVMLTARGGEDDRVRGLDLGADDYITKPFSLRELTARIRAVLRRRADADNREAPPLVYRSGDLIADFDAVSVTAAGALVRLTRREFELLRYLIQHKNRLVSRDRLLEHVWGYDRIIETRSVDVHVGRLRKKLGAAGRHIDTVVGLGYRFVDCP